MKYLDIRRGDESYTLSFTDTDAQYDRDRRDLLRAGWDVTERNDLGIVSHIPHAPGQIVTTCPGCQTAAKAVR